MSPWFMSLSWGVVLAWCAVVLLGRWLPGKTLAFSVAAAMLLWAWVPGPLGPVHWLGMAFQAPSWVSVQLCAFLLWTRWRAETKASPAAVLVRTAGQANGLLLGLAVGLGWLLFLDTFAVWPVALYAAGGSPSVVTAVAALACLPWVLRGAFSRADPRPLMGIMAVLLCVATGLPTGNVWDAVLDPGLWLVLQWIAIRSVWSCYKNKS